MFLSKLSSFIKTFSDLKVLESDKDNDVFKYDPIESIDLLSIFSLLNLIEKHFVPIVILVFLGGRTSLELIPK